jgi:phytoene dehydrogenase-like protein
VTALLDGCAPGLSRLVEAREILTPLDIGREAGTDGGHWHHVEAGLDHTFWLRPVPQLAQYRTPLDGLYLCGAGTHPGGGFSGAAGANAAHAALADSRRPKRVRA